MSVSGDPLVGTAEKEAAMKPLSKKLTFFIPLPTEDDPRSDCDRVLDALRPGFGELRVDLTVMRMLYPACRSENGQVTATMIWQGDAWHLTRLEAGDTTSFHYGLAADLGSTSVTMELVDLNRGEVVSKATRYNLQRAFGDDILTRIFYGKDQPDHIRELQEATAETLRLLMEDLTEQSGVDASLATVLVLAGNTTMIHFLMGLDAYPLFLSPYAPVVSAPGFLPGRQLGLSLDAPVFLFPSKANYMGGDIISGMIATGISRSEKILLFFDIGTNGELVAGCKDFLVAGAGAAGPALEGGVIRTGMAAAKGAVEHVSIRNGKIRLSVIGKGKVKGICGSGIVDLLAELFLEGIIDFRGVFCPEKSDRVAKVEGEWAFRYADASRTVDGQPLWFYQSDIRQFLDTKAAASTMVAYMMDAVGMRFSDVDRFCVAGAFGTYINTRSAVTIGLYPDIPPEKIACVGNSSLEGCLCLLLERSHLEEIGGILERMQYIQYGAIPNFVETMQAAAAIPSMATEAYPSVKKWLLQRQKGRK